MFEDTHWIYRNNADNTARFALGEKGSHMLACLGINPSTAEPGSLDRTMESVRRITAANGYDGWLMINLYPQRATKPDNLHVESRSDWIKQNLKVIRECFEYYPVAGLWLAYGNLIEKRDFLKSCLQEILHIAKEYKLPLLQLAELSLKGHPKHPLYQKADSILVPIKPSFGKVE